MSHRFVVLLTIVVLLIVPFANLSWTPAENEDIVAIVPEAESDTVKVSPVRVSPITPEVPVWSAPKAKTVFALESIANAN